MRLPFAYDFVPIEAQAPARWAYEVWLEDTYLGGVYTDGRVWAASDGYPPASEEDFCHADRESAVDQLKRWQAHRER